MTLCTARWLYNCYASREQPHTEYITIFKGATAAKGVTDKWQEVHTEQTEVSVNKLNFDVV